MPDSRTKGPSSPLEDLFGAEPLDTIDGAGTDEVAARLDYIGCLTGALPTRGRDAVPVDGQPISVEMADALLDGTRDDPLHVEGGNVVGGDDDNRSRVLDTESIDPVDGVGPGDPLPVDDVGTRSTASGDEGEGRDDEADAAAGGHDVDGIGIRRLPRWSKVLGLASGVMVGIVLAFAIFQPIKVLPRVRVAPGFAFVDQSGETVTSESARGSVTLYTFAPPDCTTECDELDATMQQVLERVENEVDLGETEFRLVTIALADAPDSVALASAAARSGADGTRWRWVGGDESLVKTVVGAGFRVYYDDAADGTVDFDPGFVLVDGNGVIRGDYQYQTLASDADKIVSHVGRLGDELRLSNGATSLLYEAAHLFACYG